MVVEDDADIRETLQDLLAATGRQVLFANNGLEALQVLAQIPQPCLILLDLMMPVMDGHEFLRRFQAQAVQEAAPVVVLSASRNPPPGIAAFIRKPFELDELLGVVERHCGPPPAVASE